MQSDCESADRSLAGIWAKKYLGNLAESADKSSNSGFSDRTQTADKLCNLLRFCSSRAWGKTETLLFQEIEKHRVNPQLINPWKIAEDSRLLFEQAFESYEANLTPEQFSVITSRQCGQVRHYHTAVDPRVLGFLSMQFHYTGQLLLEEFSPAERGPIADYFKVMDDHLYMPLHRSYEAATQHAIESPQLKAVQQLLPVSTAIAQTIVTRVAALNPNYQCYSGALESPEVRVSSIRDVEMFQIYLCLCVLEGNIASVQQELFPLCVMLYPPLRVNWQLVQQLLLGLHHEVKNCLTPEGYATFHPYIKAFQEMFSEAVFPENDPIWSQHPDAIRFMDMARDVLRSVLPQPVSTPSV
jgi:hypothetical protein